MLLPEASVHGRIHLDIMLMAHQRSWLVLLTLIVGLVCSRGRLRYGSSYYLIVHYGVALLVLSNLIVSGRSHGVSCDHVHLQGEWRIGLFTCLIFLHIHDVDILRCLWLCRQFFLIDR